MKKEPVLTKIIHSFIFSVDEINDLCFLILAENYKKALSYYKENGFLSQASLNSFERTITKLDSSITEDDLIKKAKQMLLDNKMINKIIFSKPNWILSYCFSRNNDSAFKLSVEVYE